MRRGGEGDLCYFFPRRLAVAAGKLNAAGTSKHCGIHPRTSRPARASSPPSAPGQQHLPCCCPPPHTPPTALAAAARGGWGTPGSAAGAAPRSPAKGRMAGEKRGGVRPRNPRAHPRLAHLALRGVRCSAPRDAPRRPHKEQEMAAASALPRLSAGPSARRRGEPRPPPREGAGAARAAPPPGQSGGCAAGSGAASPRPGAGTSCRGRSAGADGVAAVRRRGGGKLSASPPVHAGAGERGCCRRPPEFWRGVSAFGSLRRQDPAGIPHLSAAEPAGCEVFSLSAPQRTRTLLSFYLPF